MALSDRLKKARVDRVKKPQASDLDRVFGKDSVGDTIEERAATSKRIYVRSQAQLSIFNGRATGLQMTAAWALRQFGFPILLRVADEGGVVISANLSEPARSLREQREALALSVTQVARASGLTEGQVRKAEQPGSITPIRQLRSLAQALGLSDEKISVQPGAGADRDLAYRLRIMKHQGQETSLSPSLVSGLAEAAWITSQQLELAQYLEQPDYFSEFQEKDTDYSYPTWQKGYDLANRTREILGLDPIEPIASVRALIERLGIPLIQGQMGLAFAGATIVNGETRGIAVNTEGENQNVWVRRMTLSHELGHLLWDPQEKLKHLHVDRYEVIRSAGAPSVDVVESRANAFAISLLAPPQGVREIVANGQDVSSQVCELMDRYGIGPAAAKYHLSNVASQWGLTIDTSRVNQADLPLPNTQWTVNEDWTVDFFPVSGVPISRRGKFSGLVALALMEGKISLDTAASWLKADPDEISDRASEIVKLTLDHA